MDKIRQGLRPGQVWSWKGRVKLEVILVSVLGEVRLRSLDPEEAAREFPPEEWVRGKTLYCPFKRDGGDFLCHEAWSCWEDMHWVS